MTTHHTLSKSDFKLARTCSTKLYYRELRYPDTGADSPVLAMLADCGYMVDALAKALRPQGIEAPDTGDPHADFAQTMKLLERDRVTLFEPTILAGRQLARLDILEKDGDIARLIEVKATSFDSREHARRLANGSGGLFRRSRGPRTVSEEWRSYLEDVTFQTLLLERAP